MLNGRARCRGAASLLAWPHKNLPVIISYPISAVRYWGNGVWIACCPSGAANRLLSWSCQACLVVLCFPLLPPILLKSAKQVLLGLTSSRGPDDQ